MFSLFMLLLGLGLLSLAVVVIWKIYRRLNWRQGAIFSVFLFFLIGFSWISLKPSTTMRDFSTKIVPINFMKWHLTVWSGKSQYKSVAEVRRYGNNIVGTGQDKLGHFAIVGQFISRNKIQFNVKYDQEAKKRGALTSIVSYYGELETDKKSGAIVAKGAYKTVRKMGYEQSLHNPARLITVSDKWEGNFGKDAKLAAQINEPYDLRKAILPRL